jgi:hypothetical protein
VTHFSFAQRLAGLLVGGVIGLVVAVGCLLGLFLIGTVTGVIAMCATAPLWWLAMFYGLVLLLPVGSGFLVARRMARFVWLQTSGDD